MLQSLPNQLVIMALLAECKSLSVYGKYSFSIYFFIIIFGGMTTIFGMVAPLQSADCMAAPFLFDKDQTQTDQIVWFKAMGRMCGALATLFLIAVYLLGHSMTSLFLLFLWGLLNFLNFAIMIPADLKDGSEEAQRCNSYMKQQVGAFALLEAIAVLLAFLDHRCKSKSNPLQQPLSSSE